MIQLIIRRCHTFTGGFVILPLKLRDASVMTFYKKLGVISYACCSLTWNALVKEFRDFFIKTGDVIFSWFPIMKNSFFSTTLMFAGL